GRNLECGGSTPHWIFGPESQAVSSRRTPIPPRSHLVLVVRGPRLLVRRTADADQTQGQDQYRERRQGRPERLRQLELCVRRQHGGRQLVLVQLVQVGRLVLGLQHLLGDRPERGVGRGSVGGGGLQFRPGRQRERPDLGRFRGGVGF